MNDLSYGANTSPASKITTQFTCRPESFCACHLIYDIASEIHIGIAVSILKADRLEAYPTFAMVLCAAKPALPTLRQDPRPGCLAVYQRSISVY